MRDGGATRDALTESTIVWTMNCTRAYYRELCANERGPPHRSLRAPVDYPAGVVRPARRRCRLNAQRDQDSPPTDTKQVPWRGALALLIAVTVLGAALRMFRLGHQSLWNDEIVTYISSFGTPWRVITQRVENSNIPPLYYLVANASLHVTTAAISHVAWALRLPSAIVGVLTIPLMFIVVQPWLGSRIALAAATCVALSPFHIWYSQEARPYALLLALALVSVACIQRALRVPGSWPWKAATAVALAATFSCHTVGLGFVLFAALYVAIELWRRRRAGTRTAAETRDWILTFVAVAVLCVPAVYRLVSFPPTNSADAERAFSPLELGYTVWSFVVGYSFGPSLGELHAVDRHAILTRYAPAIVPVGMVIVAVLAWGAVRTYRRDPHVARMLGLWFLFPLLFVIGGALVTVHPFNVRYAVISFLPTIVVLAVGLESLRGPALRLAGWGGLFALSAVALRGYYFEPKYARDDNRGAAQFFAAHAAPDELVLAHRAFTAKDFRFYAPPGTRVVPFPPGDRPIASLNVDSTLDTLVHGATRFWIFLSRSTPAEVAPLRAYCDGVYHRAPAESFESTGVELFACVRGQDRAVAEAHGT